jgi:hypothetical protein
VTSLAGAPNDGAATLSWTNPSDGDLDRVVVRFRTDGNFPISPIDGFSAYDQSASPGGPGNLLHTGLTNGVTYSYSVFAIDVWGNASDPATIAVTPQASVPPLGQVQNLRRTDVAGN